MSSGFVSGGTTDAPIERDAAWLVAQREIEANIQKKAIEARRQTDGKSLYETLEANKAAKQDAFDEANRLKNQFRALDQDEVEFLDSVLESTRAEEARVKRETAEGLALFRQQQDDADRKARIGDEQATDVPDESPITAEESWVAGGRKRKRTKDKDGLKGVKVRRSFTSESPAARIVNKSPTTLEKGPSSESTAGAINVLSKSTTQKAVGGVGHKDEAQAGPAKSKISTLVSYGSDDNDD